uniref:Uncharacterized protein n=1 Tax=Junco hyemalis TaxID=40217 RepID=A0A8C5JIF8_JUNHY
PGEKPSSVQDWHSCACPPVGSLPFLCSRIRTLMSVPCPWLGCSLCQPWAQVALGWVSALQAGEMCIWLFQSQGNRGFPLQGVRRNRKKKGENLFYPKFF